MLGKEGMRYSQPTPQGHQVIAAKYPDDVDIERDPAVLLVADFEGKPRVVSWRKEGGWFGGPGIGPRRRWQTLLAD